MTVSDKKTIMLVGGGSGGHLTPLVSVAHALKKAQPSCQIVYVGQHGENLQEVVEDPAFDAHVSIHAGKFRRYHGETLWQHLKDVRTIVLNVRDFFRFIRGTAQSVRLLMRYKPDAILLKGGFVSVPIGFAARLKGVPYITHDSDAIPGLANRLTAKNAVLNTTALPAENYPYEQSKTRQVGIPLQNVFRIDSNETKSNFRRELGVPLEAPVIVSVGGGLGARAINQALVASVKEILQRDRHLIHFTGKKSYEETKNGYEAADLSDEDRKRVQVIDFSTELYKYTAIADVVLSRAGATNLAELEAQAKLCIIIPAPHLTGGQQLHNAKILKERHAAVVVEENDLATVSERIDEVMSMSEAERRKMAETLHALSVPHASDKIADILLKL